MSTNEDGSRALSSHGMDQSPEDIEEARNRSRLNRSRKQLLTALGFLLPNLLGFLAFTFFPVVLSFGMAFTNWSVKPSVKFQFVGLRNYIDLIGVRPINHSHPGVLVLLILSVLLMLVSSVGCLWANMARWKGTKIGGLLIAFGGAGALAIAFNGGGEAIGVAGIVAVVCSFSMIAREDDAGFGLGTVPSIVLLASSVALIAIYPPFSKIYEPRDNYFYQYLYNTVFLMLGIPLSIGGSLLLALLLNKDLPTGSARQKLILVICCVAIGIAFGTILWSAGQQNLGLICMILWFVVALGVAANVVAFRTLFYLPTFTSGVALMILWEALYNPKSGPIDFALSAIIQALHLHATPPEWLGDVAWAKPALIIMGVWTGIGGTNMLLYLAGLSNQPQELLDAAEVDGAGPWQQFRHVTWPQLAPTTFFITITAIIGGLQGGFEQARVMTGGGPAGATTTLSYYIYNKAFQDLDLGYAAAISWVLFAIVFVATAINWKFGKGLEVD